MEKKITIRFWSDGMGCDISVLDDQGSCIAKVGGQVACIDSGIDMISAVIIERLRKEMKRK